MSGHTPGVWIARPDPNGGPGDACIGLDDDVSPVDYVAVCHMRDARLIAAAPELLSVAYAVLNVSERMDYDHESEFGGLVSAAEAAIAKATGGQP